MAMASFDERIDIFDEKYFHTIILQKDKNMALDFHSNISSL